MNDLRFWKRLFIASAIVAALNALAGLSESLADIVAFNWMALGFFVVLTVALYLFAYSGIQSQQNPKFLMYAFGTMGIKFVACLIAVVVYYKVEQPDSIMFVLPFFLMYVIFTVVETTSLVHVIKEASEGQSSADREQAS